MYNAPLRHSCSEKTIAKEEADSLDYIYIYIYISGNQELKSYRCICSDIGGSGRWCRVVDLLHERDERSHTKTKWNTTARKLFYKWRKGLRWNILWAPFSIYLYGRRVQWSQRIIPGPCIVVRCIQQSNRLQKKKKRIIKGIIAGGILLPFRLSLWWLIQRYLKS